MDKWMVPTHWDFDVDKELGEFRESLMIAKWSSD